MGISYQHCASLYACVVTGDVPRCNPDACEALHIRFVPGTDASVVGKVCS